MDREHHEQPQSDSTTAQAEQAPALRRRRRDPQLLEMLGVTEEEMNDPGAALTSAGVEKMYAILKAMELPLEEDGEIVGRGTPPGKAPPVWRSMTGMFAESENAMSPRAREEALQVLVHVVLKFLRYELKAERENPVVYRTVFWDPLQKVCAALGIARAHLSRLSKEATGLAAHELMDGLHAEGVKAKMKESIHKVIDLMRREREKIRAENGGGGEDAPLTARAVWAALKQARNGPQFHRGQWALGFGFANYMRFYRACLFYHKLAPQQLEFAVIEEALNGAAAETPIEESDAAAADARIDPFLRTMKGRTVQFFTELNGFVWRKEAVERSRRAG